MQRVQSCLLFFSSSVVFSCMVFCVVFIGRSEDSNGRRRKLRALEPVIEGDEKKTFAGYPVLRCFLAWFYMGSCFWFFFLFFNLTMTRRKTKIKRERQRRERRKSRARRKENDTPTPKNLHQNHPKTYTQVQRKDKGEEIPTTRRRNNISIDKLLFRNLTVECLSNSIFPPDDNKAIHMQEFHAADMSFQRNE
jgi:hypothetical protein